MNARRFTQSSWTRLLLSCALALGAASHAVAQADGDELVENSPFLPEGYQPPQERRPPRQEQPPPPRGPEPLDQIEFRGMTTFNGQTSFSLFDPNQKRSFWVPLERTEGGFTVVEYKEGEEAVVVRHEGKQRTISLHESKVAALPEAAASPPRNRGRDNPPAAQAEDPEERMKNLAEEIRRRREMRRAALEEAEASRSR